MARQPRWSLSNAGRGATLWLAAACFAAVPDAAASGELPALEQWRFSHPIEALHVAGAQDLRLLFDAQDFELPSLGADATIPRLYLLRLVDDMRTVEPVRTREALFIRIVLPLVVRANAEIRAQRALLEEIIAARAEGRDVPPDKTAWLDSLARRYAGNTADLSALRDRVDEVPPSLAIAQAIDESAWGTAHLALQSNGMFGQHAQPGLGRGSVSVAGTNAEVAAFPSLLDGVFAYMTNINRNRAYAKLRELRAQHRRENRHPDGYTLAAGLEHYSAQGMSYVKTLRRLMHEHKLHHYDAARLEEAGPTILIHANR